MLLRREHFPEAQCLIAGSGNKGLAVRAHGKVQDSVGMTGKDSKLLRLWLLPDYYFILRVSMGGHEFVHIL